jgi:hypothetical protein
VQRIAVFLSISITAFILITIGAVLGRAGQAQPAGPALDPQLAAQLQTREAAYQALIAQANAQTQALEPSPLPTTTPVPQPTAEVYPISPELAAYLALTVAPNAYVIKPPELVLFRGAVAYEVTLNTGRVYVDAHNGAILWNGAGVASSGGSGSSGGEQERDDD